ncbi:MAG: glutamate 5-kinase [Candidatus Omnitrophica bacterium]|nr:glutamate 5-kinase [Candidatus Omnitrophota bacterium]
MNTQRRFPRKLKRVVVKVGSSLLANHMMKPHEAGLKSLVGQLCDLRDEGIEVVLVSSGAVVLGLGELEERVRPSDTPSLQAAAAIGQALLMRLYGDYFKARKRSCAQLLLTWDDFADRTRFNNARNTLDVLLERGVVPVINENDTISTDEIKFGDNDKLSALVASLVHADLLIMLSDVDGLYKKEDGKLTELFREIRDITSEIEGSAGGAANKNVSRGGMIAKVNAVKIASSADVPSIIANGQTPDVIRRIVLNKEALGTYFFEKSEKLLMRKHWITFVAKPKGRIMVDDGAKKALLKGTVSLLLPGVAGYEGAFKAGDVVLVEDATGQEIARGVTNYSVSDLAKATDKKAKREVIHIDDLVVTGK